MTITDMTLDEIKNKDKKKLFNNCLDMARRLQEKYNPFVTIMESSTYNEIDGPLSGIPYALKDNFSTSGILTTASSNILKDYIPIYDSTVYKKLKESGALLVGKTVLDELAMGGSGTTGHTGAVKNPWDINRIAGGSSAGSAASVALRIVPFAIGSDTGDSVRKPAAFCGIVGFKPTYGRISRYGLFAFASSLDHVGVFATNVKDVATVTDVLKGHDEKDMTSLPDEDKKYIDTLNNDVSGRKMFYIKEIMDEVTNEYVIKNFELVLEKCRSLGIQVDEISIDKKLIDAIYPAYRNISCAEATSNNANLTGLLFGLKSSEKTYEKMMFDTRTRGFSELIKRRFIVGSYILGKENQEKLFLNACRIRRLIVDNINELFKKYDAYILPASGDVAPLIDKVNEDISVNHSALENHMDIGNFGGFPSITIPSGFINNLPIGINITGHTKEDDVVLNIAYKLEKTLEGETNCDTSFFESVVK